MARLTQDNVVRARQLIALYPQQRSALIPLLHLLQEQDGYLSADGTEHVAELVELTPAEVRGTASFYDMFHLEPVGRYLVAVCTNIACMLDGAYELLEHMEESLGVHPGGTTADGAFTLEEAECLALCGNAPCLTVNWRFFGDMTPQRWDQLAEDLKAGQLDDEVPPHGTLCRVRRNVGLLAAGATVHSPGASAGPTADGPTAADAGTVTPPARRVGRPKAAKTVPAATSSAPPEPLDSAGRLVQLGTSRTTAAVTSTVAPGQGLRLSGPGEEI